MEILKAINERRSIRAYLDKPVTRKDIEDIITIAGKAASAINIQPWEYVVTYGEEKDRLVRRLLKAQSEKKATCGPSVTTRMPDKFTERGRNSTKIMIPAIKQTGMGFNQFIEEGSCSFYGAPIAIIVTIDKAFTEAHYLDVGMSVSYLLLAAHEKGLGTCPIGLLHYYTDDIAEMLNIPDDKKILLCIALGYADKDSPVNSFKTPREDLSQIIRWYE